MFFAQTMNNEFMNELVNFIELCDKYPEEMNDLVINANTYPFLNKKIIDGIPTHIVLKKSLTTSNLHSLIKIIGCVIKTYPIYFKNVTTEQICLNCNDFALLSEAEVNKKVSTCQSCGSHNLKSTQNFLSSYPLQIIKIQDLNNTAAMSETVEILIEGEMADLCIPGDKIAVTGVVFRKWKHIKLKEPLISTLCLKALQIIKENKQDNEFVEIKELVDEFTIKSRFEKRNWLLRTFASELHGMNHVKLGILIALIGGSPNTKDQCSSTRTNSHILLVGDAGTGKSHLLKYALDLVSPGIIINGINTSDAGLTSCAIKQGKEWALEAGALVLADMGLCCIDEFQKLKVNEKSGLLEAMEQQTISVAKAGIVTSLNTRCSVFASAGTRYDYNISKSVSENLGMSTPLISRFDLIFGLFDREKRLCDSKIADKILDRDYPIKLPENVQWSVNTLKSYISHCKKKKNKVSNELSEILLKYFIRKKALDGNNEFNTIRMLESLVRLSEGHSKLMNDIEVTEDDVFVAIILMESSLSIGERVVVDFNNVLLDEVQFNITKKKIIDKYGLMRNEK